MPFKIYPMPQKNAIKTSIENFRKVDETLYRGALPEPEEFLELKRLGFDSVISLRSGFDKKGTKERALVEKIGMEYVNFPINSKIGPTNETAQGFLDYMDKARKAHKKVFVHCKHGKDRTGTMIALYELQFRIKSFHEAVFEFFTMGYNHQKHPHMLEFVKNFAKSLKK